MDDTQKKVDDFNDKYFPGHRQREAAHPYIPSPGASRKIMPETAQYTPETLLAMFGRILAAMRRGDPRSIAEARYVINGEGLFHADAWEAREEAVKARERDPRKQLRKDKKPKKWPIPQFDQG